MAGIVFSKSSGLNDTIFGKSQEPIVFFMEQAIEAFEKEHSMISKIFNVENTKEPMVKLASRTSAGNFEPVGEGGAYPKTDVQEGYSKVLEPDTWKSEFEITQEMAEDEKVGDVKSTVAGFTLQYNRSREMFGAQMLMGGITGSMTAVNGKTFNCQSADGANLFSASHPSKTGRIAVRSNFYDAAFSYDNLCLLQEKMQNTTDDNGNLLGISPDTIIIPNLAALKKAVFNAIGAEGGEPGQSTHGMNFQHGLWNVIIWPYLNAFKPSGSVPWILMDSAFNEAYMGAMWYDRIPLTVRSEIAANDNNVFKGRYRSTAGFNSWLPFAIAYSGSGGTALA